MPTDGIFSPGLPLIFYLQHLQPRKSVSRLRERGFAEMPWETQELEVGAHRMYILKGVASTDGSHLGMWRLVFLPKEIFRDRDGSTDIPII